MTFKPKTIYSIFFVFISILCLTFLRPLLLFTYPLIFFFFLFFLKCKFTHVQVLFFITTIIVSFLSMLVEGNYIINYLVSIYLVFSPFILLTLKAKPVKRFFNEGLFKHFFKIFSYVLTIVNISAFIFAAFELSSSAYPEDVFTGFYGKGGFGSHSLSIINLIVSLYYFYNKKTKRFVAFFASGILGFYGLGLIILAITICILIIPYLIKKIKIVLQTLLISIVLVGLIYKVSPKNIDYIILNLSYVTKVFTEFDYNEEKRNIDNYERTIIPRYFTFVYGTTKLYFSNAKVFILGTSPGTFNSRTAFYLNGDLIANEFIKKRLNYKSKYHTKYVYPILNRKLLDSKRWNDGTRNQPFSTLVAVFLEYGFFIGGVFFLLFFKKIRKIRKTTNSIEIQKYIKFLSIFLFLFFIVQNHIEYPEIILYFIFIFKLIDVDNANEEFYKSNILSE